MWISQCSTSNLCKSTKNVVHQQLILLFTLPKLYTLTFTYKKFIIIQLYSFYFKISKKANIVLQFLKWLAMRFDLLTWIKTNKYNYFILLNTLLKSNLHLTFYVRFTGSLLLWFLGLNSTFQFRFQEKKYK